MSEAADMLLWWQVFSRLTALETNVTALQGQVKNMATEAELQADMDAINADFTTFKGAVAASLQALKDQIASLQAGTVMTQAQLDALTTEAANIDAAIKASPTS